MGLFLATVALVASFLHPDAAAAARHLTAPAKQPQTLYTSPSGTIDAFAQDGSVLAWFAPSKKQCNKIWLLSLATSGQVSLPDESPSSRNVTCQWDVVPPVRLALADTNVLWTLRDKLSPLPFDYLLGAGAGTQSMGARERRFQEIAHAGRGAGLWFGGMAGDSSRDGATLAYGVTAVTYVDELACLSKGSCAMKIAGGGVHLIVGRRDPIIPNTPPVVAVAVSGSSVAYIPAAPTVGKGGQPVASSDAPIEVRNARSGAVVTSVTPDGTPLALALSPSVLALLEQTKSGTRLTWYSIATGQPTGSVPLPAETTPELTASDQLIVFRVGRSIRAASVATQTVTTLAEAASTPIGLSLEGTRLAWAENVKGRGRIRALNVAGRG
jgi:hypothetical protein